MEYSNESSFVMMILVIPVLFGVTLMCDGISKLVSYEPKGWFGIISGTLFITVVIFGYMYLKNSGF